MWEYDCEQTIFEAEKIIATPSKSHEAQVQTDISTEERRNKPETAHECSPEISPQTDELSDVTDTYPHMEPDVEPNTEQPQNSATNPRRSKYNLRHNPKPNCNDDYRY